MIRYQALDKCFSNRYRKYSINDLVEACCNAIYDYCGVRDGVKRRQVLKDIAFMESEAGWSAPIEHIKQPGDRKVYFRYSDDKFSINSQPLSDEEVSKLKEMVFLLNRMKGMPQFEWLEELVSTLEDKLNLKGMSKSVIGFDQNLDYTASRHISDIFNAIVNRQPLNIEYRKFNGDLRNWLIHPYYIKQYNNRWFLFGLNHDKRVITNIPLDRIVRFSNGEGVPYIDNTTINFEEHFDDVVGVTIPDKPVEKILLRFAPERFPYVASKPIHMSMKIKDAQEGIVEISVIPNKELEQLIFSFGHHVEVLSPDWYRQHISDRISELYAKYHNG